MNALLFKLSQENPTLYSAYLETYKEVKYLLDKFNSNFPTYTDHSIKHTEEVLNLAGMLLTEKEIDNLNDDELYILACACILHDVGMCIPPNRIEELCDVEEFKQYTEKYKDKSTEYYLRDIHHEISHNFILKEFESLKIYNIKYAKAIALVSKAHRKVELQNFEEFPPRFYAKTGRQFVCLPYLGAIIRIADELDVTNMRTPSLLLKYYLPDNEISAREFAKHQAMTQINFENESVIIEAICTDHNILGALQEQFQKIQDVISNCQKVIRSISNIDERYFSLNISKLVPKFIYRDFDPKGIKYSFDVKNVISAFVGKDLYGDSKAALREGIQNAIDACNYRLSIDQEYLPAIKIFVDNDQITISDNGHGMDDFIIENYFGKLASSFYESSNVKNAFEAIGQFGIGVFSYFLIADYIDIETRNQKNKSLKFRTDQDPSGYFHFFDDFNKSTPGTNLILHLKPEYKGNINYGTLEDFINVNFPFINIDIELSDANTTEIIKPKKFTLNYELDIVSRMYHSAYNTRQDLQILTYNYSDKKVEGEVGIIVPVNKKRFDLVLERLFNRENFITRNHSMPSEIKVSQKGVYVNRYANAFSYVIGNVNIKSKLNINLNREDFRNEEDLEPILSVFEAGLMDKFFTSYLISIKVTQKKDISIASSWFLRNILYHQWYLNEEGKNILMKHLVLRVLLSGKETYLTLEEIKNANKKILILQYEQEYNSNFSKFIVIREEAIDIHLLLSLFSYGLSNLNFEKDNYYILEEDMYEFNRNISLQLHDLKIYKTPIYDSTNKIAIRKSKSSGTDDYYATRLNANSDFMRFIINNFEGFAKNSANIKILKEIFSNIEMFVLRNSVVTTKFINEINFLLNKIELPLGNKFKVKKNHF
ncbi:HD domain-containing protein [Agrobacterium tumefaciens]|nr:HD domain-containing protein [Agrobacterium tumefaciens]NTE21004.1 HD domain-containing protein [Agrobacterium tumefaciens]